MPKEKEPSWPIIEGKQVFERPVGKEHQGYRELFFHPDLMAKLKKKADKLGVTVEQLVEQIALDNLTKDKPITEAEKEMIKRCKVDPGDWFIQTEVGFYAVLTDGKIAVPKEVIKEIKLEEDQMAVLKIEIA